MSCSASSAGAGDSAKVVVDLAEGVALGLGTATARGADALGFVEGVSEGFGVAFFSVGDFFFDGDGDGEPFFFFATEDFFFADFDFAFGLGDFFGFGVSSTSALFFLGGASSDSALGVRCSMFDVFFSSFSPAGSFGLARFFGVTDGDGDVFFFDVGVGDVFFFTGDWEGDGEGESGASALRISSGLFFISSLCCAGETATTKALIAQKIDNRMR